MLDVPRVWAECSIAAREVFDGLDADVVDESGMRSLEEALEEDSFAQACLGDLDLLEAA